MHLKICESCANSRRWALTPSTRSWTTSTWRRASLPWRQLTTRCHCTPLGEQAHTTVACTTSHFPNWIPSLHTASSMPNPRMLQNGLSLAAKTHRPSITTPSTNPQRTCQRRRLHLARTCMDPHIAGLNQLHDRPSLRPVTIRTTATLTSPMVCRICKPM